MKSISIFYTFQNEKDPIPNFYQIDNNFENIDEFKIKHVLQAFPLPLDQKPYHIRFKTVCEEVEPKIMAWIDISNPNAKVPLVNSQVFMKITELPDMGLSKIYTKAKLQSFRNTQQINQNPQIHTQVPNTQIQNTQQIQKTQQNQNTQKSPAPKNQTIIIKAEVQTKKIEKQSPIEAKINAPIQQNYQYQQKVLDDLLGGDSEEFQDQSQSQIQYGQFQERVIQQTVDTDDFDFSDFKEVQQDYSYQQPQQQQQQQHQQKQNQQLPQQKQQLPSPPNQYPDTYQPKKNNELNLLGEEDTDNSAPFSMEQKNQNSDQLIDREQIRARNKITVENVVQGKVDELNKIWDDEENYKVWRQEAKDQLEPIIMKWAFKDGSRSQIRNMLSLLHEILWEGADWKPCSFTDLLNDGAVKRKYHDAIRVVHPDKNQFRDNRQRYISERIFFELNQSFNLHRVQYQEYLKKTQNQQQN